IAGAAMMIYLQKRVIDQNGRSPSSTENSKIRCGMTDDGVAAVGIWAKSDQGEHCSTPIWRENKDVRSGLWPKPWMA
ncbi:hypothetical protein, partial [Aeromonas caviae]|uniref:hypothetical protein n=1 Tax=Aeromonas caviae TaxID=648 RepID=UPI001CC452F4